MKSELLALKAKHWQEIESLRGRCRHPKKMLKKRIDRSRVGAGSCYPSVHVVCKNCGKKKIIFNLPTAHHGKVELTLSRQGLKKYGDKYDSDGVEERMGCFAQYDWELE